jgi:hypothetical protein
MRGNRVQVLLLFLLAGAVFAGELNISASVDRTTVGLGEPFTLTVTVEGANIGAVPEPQLPALDGFDKLGSTKSQSTSISIINGRVQQQSSVSFIWTLAPKKLGELTIGPCRLVYKGTEYQTEPITITVVKSATRPQTGPKPKSRQFSPFDLFEEPEPEPVAEGDIFVTASADRTTVYQGEQVTVTWTLYTTREVARLDLKETPSLTGFWADDIYQPQKLEYQTRTIRGRSYYAAVLRKTALFPTQSGELRVGSMKLEGEALSPGFFFVQSRPFAVSSEPVKITVKPLPEAGKPASFTGGVGSFEVSASLSSSSSSGGEPVTLVITVSGTGNLGLIAAPALPQIPGLKILNPETKDNFSYAVGRLSGTRKFSYPILPGADGKYRIPEIELGFFDPKTGSYYTKKTPPLELVVTGVPANQAGAEPAAPGLRVLGSDIRHIKTGRLSSELPVPGWLPVLLYPLGIAVLVAGAILGRHRQRLLSDTGYARRSRALGQARQRLKQAEQALRHNRQGEFYSLVRQALLGFTGDRFNIDTAGMTGGELGTSLNRLGVDEGLINRLLDTLNRCEVARFSPGAIECDPHSLLAQARELIGALQVAGNRTGAAK